ncbi:MAG: UDP-N-acetylmuramoyl-L-alanine--D-glutamate ligase [Chthoniobacterales bacterium]
MEVAGKHIAVLGLARSGESVARLLLSKGAKITVLDSGNSEPLLARAEKLRSAGMTVLTGPDAVSDEAFSLVVVSPGIDLASPFVRQYSDRGIPVTGELEVAWQFCTKPVIAITGTNGKTTTTELISAMLNSAGKRTVACGNIGLPFSEVVAHSQENLDVITVEVSSFQLETISSFRPQIALWLNLTPDHLDRYPSMQEYREAKLRVFEYQTNEDFAVCNAADDLPNLAAKKITFSAYGHAADFTLVNHSIAYRGEAIARLDSFQLIGLHNIENLMAALATGHVLGITFADLLPALQNYRPSPHRCELVATIDGVRYINDSKSTNVNSLAKALTLDEKKVILIAGGKDKGFEFGSIRQLVGEKVSTAILIGEMAERISSDWSGSVPCLLTSSLQDAVQQAHSLARAGDTVLFSPGTSSFDMFRDYADRGEQFRQAATTLSNLTSIPL